MPTVADDIILSQLSYRDDASTPEPGVDKAANQKVLTDRWQKMKKAGWTYLGNQDTYRSSNDIGENGFQAHAYKDPNEKIVIAIRGTEGKGKNILHIQTSRRGVRP